MPTLGELTEDVIGHQFSPSRYTPYVQGKLNQAQAYITAQTDFRELQRSVPMVLVPGTPFYPIPSDFQRLRSVLIRALDGSLMPLHSLEKFPFDPLTPAHGRPVMYKIEGSQISFSPTPNAEGTVTFNYYAKPPTLAGLNDVPLIPEQYQYLMAHYASKFAFERENDYPSAVHHWQMFEAGLMKCRGEVQHDTNDRSQPRIVGDAGTRALLVEGF